ncbi:gliding motility-associated ABC transporter ATP-binding subunit GldA [bacterium SCSIO 12643]|nr:gliding motility-associated ABC transporter ATP-binding subunit GldA [bacterium SCSIO 12643]
MSISVKNITKIYGAQKALNNVSFEIQPGEIVGFLGPNGAGKSTMMKIITGYLPQTSGEVSVIGMHIDDNALELKKQIGYLPEHNPLYLEMYVWEFLEFTANVTQVQNKKERIAEVIKLVGLEKEQNKLIESLSKGYRQRVGLAHAILHDPQVLILDEPTTGLDPNQIVEIRNLIREIGKEKTVMLSTHIMQEVEAICSRVIIINEGQIVADKPIENINEVSEGFRIIKVQFEGEVSEVVFHSIKNIVNIQLVGESTFELKTKSSVDIRPDIFSLAVKKDLKVLELSLVEKQLEQVFHDLTEKKKK